MAGELCAADQSKCPRGHEANVSSGEQIEARQNQEPQSTSSTPDKKARKVTESTQGVFLLKVQRPPPPNLNSFSPSLGPKEATVYHIRWRQRAGFSVQTPAARGVLKKLSTEKA